MKASIIVGTAGHVDHGKTQLVKALTGVDTDRLKEEKERGISIELGFAPLSLPSGITAGIVDVPGHERFVKNMLAGAGGIDLVLLVVAADEGVMPQTREHLDILEILQVQKGVVALTKVDLAEEEWLLLVEEEVRELLRGTRLEDAPLVPVSVVTGEGLDELRRVLDRMAQEVVPKPLAGHARLPVDRVFSITGFGTVATGTLLSGKIRTGDVLQVLPSGLQGRVRSLQVHGARVDEARAGQRTAVNLTGLEINQMARGDVLVTPGAFQAVKRLTASLHLLPRAARPLKNWQRVHFHLATQETLGRVRLLDREELAPGKDALVQLELEAPVIAAAHDRFVIRHYSPVTTIGGGEVIEVGGNRYRRFRPEVLARLERKLSGSPAARVAEELRAGRGALTPADLAARSGLSEADVKEIVAGMAGAGEAHLFDFGNETFVISASRLEEWGGGVTAALREYHKQFPLRPGLPKEELRSRLFQALPPRLYQALLEYWVRNGAIGLAGQTLALPGFAVRLTPEQDAKVEALLEKVASQPFAPPTGEEIRGLLGADGDLLQYCVQQGHLVKVGEDFYFSKEAVAGAWSLLEGYLRRHGEITVAAARDLLGTSRRYCLPLLEYFDREKKTRRVGDKRVLFGT
ncbi:MAG: selenocysteine-specific translation elongation factor [Bacillota bacterium]|nr:selenocysteine-specific translation elongation factor [Bacillota bacterium]